MTGANRGIGLEICRQLAAHQLLLLLTARDKNRGLEAVEKLKSSGLSNILFHQLDVTDTSSVASLVDFIKTHFGKLDILVNNAGISGGIIDPNPLNSLMQEGKVLTPMDVLEVMEETYEVAEECLNINYYGLKRVTEALIPLLQLGRSPRIINVTSILGQLKCIPNESIRKEMGDINDQAEERLDRVLQSFLIDFKEGKLEANDWPTRLSAYHVSKVAATTYTRILAERYPAICINCVEPGCVKTDINFNSGILTVEEGAKGPVMLALLPEGSPSGLFYDRTTVTSFE